MNLYSVFHGSLPKKGFSGFTKQEAKTRIFVQFSQTLDNINKRLSSEIDFVLSDSEILLVQRAFKLASETLDRHLKSIDENRFNIWEG